MPSDEHLHQQPQPNVPPSARVSCSWNNYNCWIVHNRSLQRACSAPCLPDSGPYSFVSISVYCHSLKCRWEWLVFVQAILEDYKQMEF